MRYFSIFMGDNPSILVKLLFPSQECGEFRRFRGPKGDDEIRDTEVGPILLNWRAFILYYVFYTKFLGGFVHFTLDETLHFLL